MEREIHRLTVEETREKLRETERSRRIEAGTAEIKRGESQLPPGWEWVWMEDPWTDVLKGSEYQRMRLNTERGGRYP